MTQLQVEFDHQRVMVYFRHQSIGTIELAENPYHQQHTYLTFHLTVYDNSLAAPLFQLIHNHTKKPLQVMLSSTNQILISFLEAGGFRCKRICYEMAVSTQDYLGEPIPASFQTAERTSQKYQTCSRLLLHYYIESHKAISPFTGIEEDFFKTFPETVYYQSGSKGIENLAFIEDNEIAYVWGDNEASLRSFLNQIVPYLFQQYTEIHFEADDVDTCAMTLKSLFKEQTDEHWDTYIFP
ncbi:MULTISPECIES: GNAT family acetyltransferase [unclassified Streptococcus]|uniref:GNAT family acetyltransferase n=1 Tax=unclassified Streptococcus TaxID=2608887 RepID=UPI00107275B4|nr:MULTISPECIES: GNAT family acetyltransferase [unclassified Streptococcus]MBF0788038.1 GNAT family acetyltransferase [Streptococcus sp. 19428wC2_LYSM12]MCQ9211802.1 GNAT family acetyltransferase [Streptococcus sp. B01]MCQ9212922.1 GNAT family acetyltransferase [Streptococcus sp. O1]TFV04910.1 GNAT family acetyltransferase [Streptococcus sp. LYSM12]